MPELSILLARRAGMALEQFHDTTELVDRDSSSTPAELIKRVNIPCCNDSSPAGLIEASTVDPWRDSGKYALGWMYLSIILLTVATLVRFYYFWNDKIRTAAQKERTELAAKTASDPDPVDYDFAAPPTSRSTQRILPTDGTPPAPPPPPQESSISTNRPLNTVIAVFRFAFYLPLPIIRLRKGWRPLTFPPLGVVALITTAVAFVLCYSFVPQPLYWQSMRFGAPPIAVRSGMLAVAMMPWIVALSMKANFITMMTGIGHERLNVLHRWAAYICLLLSLIHTIPFYIQPIWDRRGSEIFHDLFASQNFYVYGTGISKP